MGKSRHLSISLAALPLFLLMGCLNAPLPPDEGSLSATFILSDSENSEGIEVILPGTSYRGFTDREGRIVFDRLPPRSYEILAKHKDYLEYREANLEVRPGDSVFLGKIFLEPIPKDGTIVGIVEVEGVPDATPEIRLLGSNLSVRSASDGNFQFAEVPPGEYEIAVYYPGFAAETPTSVSVEAGATISLGRLELSSLQGEERASGAVTGRVVLVEEDSYEGVEIFLPGSTAYTASKANGSFWLGQIESGTHTLLFEKPGYIPARVPIQVTDENTITELPEIILEKIPAGKAPPVTGPASSSAPAPVSPDTPGILSGFAFFPDRQDHSGIVVRIPETPLETVTGADGAYVLPEVPPGDAVLRFEAEGYQAMEFADLVIEPGDVTRVPRVELYPAVEEAPPPPVPSRVYGQILLEDSGPQAGIQAALEGTSYLAVTDSKGSFLIPNVPPGSYSIVVNHNGYLPFSEPVEVGPGVDVPVPVITLQRDREYLQVIEANPGDGARRVEVTDRVTLRFRFNDRLLQRTVAKQVFLEPPAQVQVTLPEIDLLQVELLRRAQPGVEFETDYVLTLGTGIESPEGNTLEEPYVVRFQTGGPRVLSSYPADGARDVLILPDSPMRVYFNDAVDVQSLRDRITISPGVERPVIIANRDPIGSVVQIQFNPRESRTYRLTIPSAVRTMDGKKFENTPYTIRFKTGSYDDLPDANEASILELDDY
jgi:hypothetical protein